MRVRAVRMVRSEPGVLKDYSYSQPQWWPRSGRWLHRPEIAQTMFEPSNSYCGCPSTILSSTPQSSSPLKAFDFSITSCTSKSAGIGSPRLAVVPPYLASQHWISSSYATTFYFQEDHAFDRSIGSAISNLLVIRNGYDQCRHSGLTPRRRSLAQSKHLNNAWLGTGEQLHEKPSKISIALTGLITRLQATFTSANIDCNLYITVLET